jgi:2-C-methyl-D-erythritol 2,4-cyclodiphosphate synthase
MMEDICVGIGYDVHRLEEGCSLILGGVEIDHPKGLAGHSDADVLLHAITDALLGALALGDIGSHFPDNDKAYKNIDSRILLRRSAKIIQEKEWKISNVDATIVAQQPKLAPYIKPMETNIAEDLSLQRSNVSVKATTSEELGFEGRREGISARAVVLVYKDRLGD